MSWCPSAAEGMCNPEPERVPAAVQLIQPVAPPLSPLSFPRLSPLPRRSYAAWSSTLRHTHPVHCRLSASCSRPSARRLPARRHASLSALSSLQPRLPQPRRLEPFLPTPPCSLLSVPSPLLSACRLAVRRRSEHSHLAACRRISDHRITPQPLAPQSTAAAQTVINTVAHKAPGVVPELARTRSGGPGARAAGSRPNWPQHCKTVSRENSRRFHS
jgi:hypothetical protein